MTGADVELAKQILAQVRRELGDEAMARLGPVQIIAKPKPEAVDLKRGAGADQRAYFWGQPCEVGQQGSPELPDPGPASGEIVVFIDNLQPVSPERLRIVFLHEYMHALGEDEDTIQAMGLYLEEGPICTPF